MSPETPQAREANAAMMLYVPGENQMVLEGHCFLCGTLLTDDNRTDEHVIPQWLQRTHNLWQQRMHLLNGTTMPYASLKIPCCSDCNNVRLCPIEEAVSIAFAAGP